MFWSPKRLFNHYRWGNSCYVYVNDLFGYCFSIILLQFENVSIMNLLPLSVTIICMFWYLQRPKILPDRIFIAPLSVNFPLASFPKKNLLWNHASNMTNSTATHISEFLLQRCRSRASSSFNFLEKQHWCEVWSVSDNYWQQTLDS